MHITQLLKEADAFHEDKHFVYFGGDHGHQYINLRILRRPAYHRQLAILSLKLLEKIITEVRIDINEPLTIIGPDTVGAIIAEAAAVRYNSEYGTDFKYLRIKAEENADGTKTFTWDRDDPTPFLYNSQIVYVDDLMTAGSTLERIKPLVQTYGDIHTAGVIADRSGMTAEELGVPNFTSLLQVHLERYPEDVCPLCKANVPIVTNLGHGTRFQMKRPAYSGGFVSI